MANRKWLAISYGFIFLSIYFLFISYASIFSFVREQFDYELPQTVAVNSTATAMSSMTSWTGMVVVIFIVAIVLGVLFLVLGSRAMGAAV